MIVHKTLKMSTKRFEVRAFIMANTGFRATAVALTAAAAEDAAPIEGREGAADAAFSSTNRAKTWAIDYLNYNLLATIMLLLNFGSIQYRT